MRRFQDRSIRSKLIFLTLSTSTIVLLLTGLVSITYHLIKVRQTLRDNLSTLAWVIGTNSTAALTFNDPKAGGETLGALRGYPRVIAAVIYDKEGRVFSTYIRDGIREPLRAPQVIQEDLSRFEEGSLFVFHPVFMGMDLIGTVYIRSDLEDLYSAIRQYSIVTLLLIAAASLVALLLANRFQRAVSEPILRLAEVARAISVRKDYSIRAGKPGPDEIGLLVKGFNEMLNEIQSRDAALREALRIKSEFVSNVSHELRTPLNAIIGYNTLLLDEAFGALSEKQKQPLERVRKNAGELSNLIESVLGLSRIEAGKMPITLDQVDLPALIRETVSGLESLFEKKSLFVRFDRPGTFPTIRSDPGKIKQIAVNLLINAVKFTHEGGVTLFVRDLPGREGVEFSVRDTGIGIKPEELSKIFEAFHQVDASATREFGGVGLGLAIAKNLVDLLQGEIRVESEVQKGSTFTVFLPYQIEKKEETVEPSR
jgi:signal transduction histidine kinase